MNWSPIAGQSCIVWLQITLGQWWHLYVPIQVYHSNPLRNVWKYWNKLKKYRGQSHEWAWSSGGNEGPEKVACPRWVSVGESCGDRFGALPGVLRHSLKGKAASLSIPWCWCIPCEAVERIVITHTYWNSSSIHLTISSDTVHLCASLIHVNFSFCFWPEPRTCDCANMSAKRVTWTKLFANRTSEGQRPNTLV